MDELKGAVEASMARRLDEGIRLMVPAHRVVALLFFLLYLDPRSAPALLLWLLAVWGGFELPIRHLFRAAPSHGGVLPLRRSRVIAGIGGLVWAAGMLLLPGAPEGFAAPFPFLAALLLGGGLVFFSADTRAFALYTGGIVLGLALAQQAGVASIAAEGSGFVISLAVGAAGVIHLLLRRQMLRAIGEGVRLTAERRRETREREILDETVRTAGQAVLVLLRGGTVLRANPAFQSLVGLREAIPEGSSLDELRNRIEGFEQLLPVIGEGWRQGRSAGEATLVGGEGRAVEVRISATRGEGSEEESGDALFVTAEDISALRRAEDARRQAEFLYRETVESSRDLVFRLDAQGRWTFLNRAVRDIYGVGSEELLGRDFRDFLDPDLARRDGEVFQRVLQGFEVEEHETIHRSVSGETRRLSFSARPILDADGRVVGAQGTARDVTEEVEYRQTLERVVEQSELIRSLLNATPDPFFVKDEKGAYRAINEAWRKVLGRPEGEILGRRDEELLAGERAAAYRRLDFEAFRLRAPLTYDEWIDLPALGPRLFQTVRTPQFAPDGRPTGLIGISRDVTDRRLQEDRTRQLAQEADRANRMKSAFLASMSHEIRTPMNGVLGMTQVLLDTRLEPRQREAAELVRSSAEALLSLLNDILDLSKIEAGRLDLELLPFDLPALVEEVAAVFSGQAATRSNTISVDLGSEVPRGVLGDPGRIRQILGNLVSNAVKFTEGGRIEIRVDLEFVDSEDHILRFSVRDTGMGIEEARLESIFQEFTQADTSIARKFGGTGLGLSISRQLARLMRGELEVRSTVGEGSEFSFTIPLRATTELPRRAERRGRLRWIEGARVLVAEDNLVNQQIVVALLEGQGFAVDVAGDGSVACEIVRRRVPDVVLMDLQMPVMDGIRATRMIRGELGLTDLPIVALTAHALGEERQRCLDAGMNDFLSKPFRPDDLYEILHRYVGAGEEEPDGPSPETGPAAPGPDARGEATGPGPASTPEPSAAPEPSAPPEPSASPRVRRAGGTGPAVDVDGFRRSMREAGIESVVPLVLAAFRDEAPGRMAVLERGVAERDLAAVSSASHALKSSSANIAARRLHPLMIEVETLARAGDQAGVEGLLPAVREEFEAVMDQLAREVPSGEG